MSIITYQLLVENWVQSSNPTDGEVLAVVHFLDYIQRLEEDNQESET
jgi:hypothetical protein